MENIGVVGAGTMGQQIALCAALAGYQVKCTDADPGALTKAKRFADGYLRERVEKGKLPPETAIAARAGMDFTDSLEAAVRDADMVIEAVMEDLAVKRHLFAKLDALSPPHALLTTNSSYIVSSQIAVATKRPEKVCNMHFFNPALVMKLVEVVQGPHTSEKTSATVMATARRMGKIPVLLRKEVYGFLVNRIYSAIKNEALYLYDLGVASYEDIDTAVVNGLGHSMGPFRLMDLTGIDLAYKVALERFRETGNPADRPSPTLAEKYVRNEWGRKSGRGFYQYKTEK